MKGQRGGCIGNPVGHISTDLWDFPTVCEQAKPRCYREMHGDRQQFSRLPSVFVNTLPEVCRARTPPARVSHVHGVGRSAHRGRADHRSDSEVEAARDRSRVAHTRRASSVVSGDPRGLRAFFPAQCERASGYFLFASPSDRKGRRTCAISGRSHESSSPNLRHGPQPTSRGVVHPREALR